MAKPVTLGSFQAMQRGEIDASGDADWGNGQDVASVDPLTGDVVEADPSQPTPEQQDREATEVLKAIGAGQLGTNGQAESEYDVAPDGTVQDWRTVVKDRAAALSDDDVTVSATVHTITDDEPRFSGSGAERREEDRSAPWMALAIPSEAAFGDDEFIASTALAHRAEILIERHYEHFDHLRAMKVVYLWKKAGGKSKGRGVYGKTTKPSGLLKMFSEATFVIWLAADHCRGAGYKEREIEALLFHEMLHTGLAEVDDETGRGGGPTLVPHELEIFRAEIEVYGLWTPEIREVAPAFDGVARQPGLFDDVPADTSGFVPARMARADGAGVLIHADGSPLSADEIAAQEAAELADAPAHLCDRCEDAPVAANPGLCSDCAAEVAEDRYEPSLPVVDEEPT